MSNETNVNFRQIEFALIRKKVKKLQTNRTYRDRKKLFFAEGIRNFVTAFDNKYPIQTLIYSEKLLISPVARKLVRKLKRRGIPFARASPEQFRSISKMERASGVAAIYRQKVHNLEYLKQSQNFCWTAVSNMRSAANFGTLIRTSSAIGAGGFILVGNQIDPFDTNVVRPAMGAIFKQKIVRTNFRKFRNWIKSNDFQIVGASPKALEDYDAISYSSPTILMLGNERKGLSDLEKSFCKHLVKIPMIEGTDSLNVAIAGSLLLYEIFRSSTRR